MLPSCDRSPAKPPICKIVADSLVDTHNETAARRALGGFAAYCAGRVGRVGRVDRVDRAGRAGCVGRGLVSRQDMGSVQVFASCSSALYRQPDTVQQSRPRRVADKKTKTIRVPRSAPATVTRRGRNFRGVKDGKAPRTATASASAPARAW